VNIREATREDNRALCNLERRTPLNLGDHSIWLDRTSFFALHDLQAETVVMVAEQDGEIVGADRTTPADKLATGATAGSEGVKPAPTPAEEEQRTKPRAPKK